MNLYNEDLLLVGNVSESYNSMFNQQAEFALNLLNNKQRFATIFEKRIDSTILVECDTRKGYRSTEYNGKILQFPFSTSAGAFVGCAKQTRRDNGWHITNGIYIRRGAYDMSNPETCKKTLPHEFFHALSDNVEANFDADGYCYTKSGFKVIKYDEKDNEIDIGLNASFLTEGTTEMLANMFNNTLKPHAYSFPVFIARILSYAQIKPSLLETYFSDDIADVKNFFGNFDKSQTCINSKDLIDAPITENFWKDEGCAKIIKGCLQYTINSINSVDELKSFYQEIKQITITIADSIVVNVGEEHKNKVVKFVRQSLTELLDNRKQEITQQQKTL